MALTTTQKRRITKFVEALRSGKYKQGKRALHPTNDTFCCLGVACDLSKKSLKLAWAGDTFDNARYELPESVRDYYGFKSTDPPLTEESFSAAQMNDEHGFSFKKIATLFEEKYLKPTKKKAEK